MNKTIDCLFIGHNEMNFADYERNVRTMGVNSGAYRDLNLNFIHYNNSPYSVTGIFNLFNSKEKNRAEPQTGVKALNMLETFSPAIAYLGTYLKRRGLTFDCINSFRGEQGQLAKKLERDSILTIAIITTLYVSPLPILEIIDFIKSTGTRAKIIIGGPFISTGVRSMDEVELS
ncbi:MAG: hypothetical protein GY757_00565, partial [bacterium]|nr:hypothetical protein [bacterium]